MKKSLLLGICFVSIAGVGGVHGQPIKRHTLEIKPEISYIIYKEPSVMKSRGMMHGLIGSYIYHRGIMLKAEGKGSWGRVDYHNSGSIDNIRDYMLEFRGLGGWDLSLLKEISMTPYIGIGYRYLNDDSSGKVSSIGAHGYERESNYIYNPLGLEFNIDTKVNWLITQTVEYDYFWGGKQKSHLSDVSPLITNISNRQRKGYGFRASLGFRKQFKAVEFAFGPFIKYWSIKKSEEEVFFDFITDPANPVWIGWEPKNRSKEMGIFMSLKF